LSGAKKPSKTETETYQIQYLFTQKSIRYWFKSALYSEGRRFIKIIQDNAVLTLVAVAETQLSLGKHGNSPPLLLPSSS
jgi:hypothetical protein